MKQTQFFVEGTLVVMAVVGFTTTVNAQSIEAAETVGPVPTVQQNAEPAFGQRGQWYLYTPSLFATHNHYDQVTGGPASSDNSLSLSVEFGRFVRNRFSLGVEVDGNYGWQTQDQATTGIDSNRLTNWMVGLHLVAGWQRPLSSWLSFWPKVRLGGSYGRMDEIVSDYAGNGSKETLSSHSIDAGLRLPLVFHVTRHLFVEVAWLLNATTGWNQQYSTVQAWSQTTFGLGGWF